MRYLVACKNYCAVRDDNALDFTYRVELARLVPSGTARLRAIACIVPGMDIHIFNQLRIIPALALVRRPGHHQSLVVIRHDLEYAGGGWPPWGIERHAYEQTLVEQLNLLHRHVRRATPVCPVALVLLIVVLGAQVRDSVDKTQDEAIRGPIDDNIHGHVVVIEGNAVCFLPGRLARAVA